jgi:hypothetical protein
MEELDFKDIEIILFLPKENETHYLTWVEGHPHRLSSLLVGAPAPQKW